MRGWGIGGPARLGRRRENRAMAKRGGASPAGFVGDHDIVALRAVRYESPESSGSGCDGMSIDGECAPLPK